MKTAEEVLNDFPNSSKFTFRETIIQAMEAYHAQFKDGWVDVRTALPEKDGQYLVNRIYNWLRGDKSGVYHQIEILTFNSHHACWDQEDGDDYACDIYQVSHYMPLPSPPDKAKD